LSAWRQNRLPDNLPKLVLANVPQIPQEVLAEYRKAMGQAKTGLFDTHPSDRERIAHAKAEGPEGIFTLDGPATDVFRNFDSLAKLVTFEFYRGCFGPNVTKSQLFPVAELVQSQAVEKEGYEAFERYFLHAYSPGQPLNLPFDYPEALTHVDRGRSALEAARAEMEATRDDSIAAWKEWKNLFGVASTAETAATLLKAGVKIKAAEFDLPEATARAADDQIQRSERRAAKQLQGLTPFTEAAVRRLTTGLALLEAEAVVKLIPDGHTIRDEARALYACAAHLGSRVTGETPPVYRASVVLNRLLAMYQQGNNQNNVPLTNSILRAAALLHDRLEEFRWKIGDLVEYPFEHATEEITLGRYILAIVPPKDEIGLLIEAADDSVKRMIATYGRALGRLTYAAEEVERALGLSPILTEPPASDDADDTDDDED
ncbi:MAG: Zn-dependent protease with chaperone function, partial [Isosphaeraceae bacterium]